jgi:hypothetical protein
MAKEILRSLDFKSSSRALNLPVGTSASEPARVDELTNVMSASSGFDATVAWYFNSTDEGWTATNGTIAFDSSNGKGVLLTDTSGTLQAIAVSPAGLTIDGNLYRRVKASITFITAPAPISATVPELRYHTAGHGSSASFRKISAYPIPFSTVGDTVVIDFDMETATGAPDWYAPPNNTITQIRLLLTDAVPSGTVLRINWVAVGRNAPANVTPPAFDYKQLFSQVTLLS